MATPPTTPPMIGPSGVEFPDSAAAAGPSVPEFRGSGDGVLVDAVDVDAELNMLVDVMLEESTIDDEEVEAVVEDLVDEGIDEGADDGVDDVVVADTGGGRAKIVSTGASAPHAI
ncbi:hypothetical protein Q7P37_001475 [Cladosporium fusiforme]